MTQSFLSFGAPGMQEIVVILLILIPVPIWIWSLVHCVKNKRLSEDMRIIGIILIAVLGIIGTVIYPFLPRKKDGDL